jgi:rhodanese-related sulfurtransferase
MALSRRSPSGREQPTFERRIQNEVVSMAKTVAEMVGEAMAQIPLVSPRDAAAESERGEVVFLDVREPVEWEHHIPSAVQVPRGLLEFAADPASPRHHESLQPDARVVVYCRSGVRAALAAFTLTTMGYENVVNLEGGFAAWQEAGLPTAEHHAEI